MKIFSANLFMFLISLPRLFLFKKQSRNIKKHQKKVLTEIIKKNRNTIFGKKHSFNKITNIKQFQSAVPLSDYEDYIPFIKRISRGEKHILTSDIVSVLEPTSGSTGPSKLIPFTKTLGRQFHKAIKPWIADMFLQYPRLFFGSSYWQITPQIKHKQQSEKVKIGFQDDSQYFGIFQQICIYNTLSVPTVLSQIDDIENLKYATLFFLLKDKNLAFISVWNPSFLSILMRKLQTYTASAANDIKNGSITFPYPANNFPLKKIKPDPKRAAQINRILDKKNYLPQDFWHKLTLISCWTHGNAKHYLKELRNFFPNIKIAPKGLISTEAFISFPFKKGTTLALGSHFFEFIDQETGAVKTADKIEKGKQYSTVVTTAGGFYRYKLNDIIQVIGFYNQCPIIIFKGKGENVSDLCGEKLNEQHVANILEKAFKIYDITPSFFMLAPEKHTETFYVLFLETEKNTVSTEKLSKLRTFIENRLRLNYHYNYARELEQLSQVKIFLINQGAADTYLKTCTDNGQKLGDIKHTALHKRLNWSSKFRGNFI